MSERYFFKTVALSLLMGCSAQHKIQNKEKEFPPEKINVSNGKNADNKILFLTLRMSLADSITDTYRFAVLNTIFADGVLNSNSFINDLAYEPNNLYCEITDDDKKRIDFFKVQNPLLKVFEYSPDKKLLEKKLFTSKTGELYLRFQLTKNSKYLTIYKPLPDLQTLKKIYYAQI